MKILYIFTRDLRIVDNNTFNVAISNATILSPIFIFTPEQVTRNSYKSDNAIQFMIESLEDLSKELKNSLSLFYGDTIKTVEKLIKRQNFEQVYITKDYTPYANKRENKLQRLCNKYNVELNIIEDYCLNNPNTVLTGAGTAYQKYTPYYRSCIEIDPDKPTNKKKLPKLLKLYSKYSPDELYVENDDIHVRGGRKEGLKRLIQIKNHKNYNIDRNDLNLETTNLSAYNKFGCISIREVYWKIRKIFGKNHNLISQLIWRDFYYQLGVAFPHVIGSSLKSNYDRIKWNNNKAMLKAWKKGKTGFPIVDAAMTQLNETGYMHNRGRLIVSSFLVKTLLCDWREGEKYFAQCLCDYDPLVNNGNWQWTSGSGADSQPYFRIFNPWSQSKKHDKDALYIKYWLPELKDIPSNHIHKWYDYCDLYKVKYPNPIVDYNNAKLKVLKEYKRALS